MPNTPANAFTSPNSINPIDNVIFQKGPVWRELEIVQSQGWQSWTYDLGDAYAAQHSLTSQTVHASLIPLRGGQVIENILVAVSTAASGTAITAGNLGIANFAGYVLANTSSYTTAASVVAGVNAYALTAAFTVPADGVYYAYIWNNGTFGTTQPVYGASVPSANWTAAHTIHGNLGTSITTVPNVANNGVGQTALTFSASTGPYFWFAVQ